MTPGRKLALAVAALACYVVGGLLLFVVAISPGLEADERRAFAGAVSDQPVVAALLGLFFVAGLALLVRFFFKLYVQRAVVLAEETRLMGSVNPGHRITPSGPAELRELAAAINELGRRYEALEADVDRRARAATLDAHEDRDRLAAVMAQLTQPVLVCTGAGRILLYNDAAKRLLGGGQEEELGGGQEGLVGLGRSVFALLDRDVVAHALARARLRARLGDVTRVSRIAATAAGGELVRVDVVPIRERTEAGDFLVVLEQIGRSLEAASPEPPRAQPNGLPLDEILAGDLATCVQASLERDVGLAVAGVQVDEDLWLEVDTLAVVGAAAGIAARLSADRGLEEAVLRIRRAGSDACLDLVWEGDPLDPQALTAWPGASSAVDGEPGKAHVRLVLAMVEAQAEGGRKPSGTLTARPLFFDFDLFDSGRRRPEWDARLLAELLYTVLDVETTGLDPSGGDEIVSIGAVRVAGGRLLRDERFDRLVDPKRSISPESVRAHGISREMLEGQPTIEEVLPLFAEFAEASVLVGHNVAFDMRFLELKEESTGIQLRQPVLDTLLLSSVVHPNSDDHSLEALAERLGVPVAGRHDALSDAVLTAEILLKLLPLLAEEGVLTLENALEASRRTTLAKLSY